MDEYVAGYGKPPKEHQFKKGQSGNRKGRPKGSKNIITRNEKFMYTPISVTENGKVKTMFRIDALLAQLWNKALKGDHRAMKECLNLAQTIQAISDAAPTEKPDREKDKAVKEMLHKRFRQLMMNNLNQSERSPQ